MHADRSIVLAESLKIEASEVRWHFTADYYDGPISGLAFCRGRLYRFCCFPEDIPQHHVYVLHELTPEEMREELRIKEKFETLVGTHWSFDAEGRPLPHVQHPKELAQRFYDEEKFDRRPDPRDRPIIAWFDVEQIHETSA